MDKPVCVYAGDGAVLARDIEVALDKLGTPYRQADEQDIRGGGLGDCSLLIIPGGYTARYVHALGEEGFEQIREFVARGGAEPSASAPGAAATSASAPEPTSPPEMWRCQAVPRAWGSSRSGTRGGLEGA